ncbi:MAG: hypothetical protein AAGA48_03195 [Myxococcota bacterium]
MTTRWGVAALLLTSGCFFGGGGNAVGEPIDGDFWDQFIEDNVLSGPGGAADTDEDGDGLLRSEEEAFGSDPAVADTDGDGFNDGEEVAGNTDPTNADDRPYLGGWAIGDCRNDLTGTGSTVGSVAFDFELRDQFGDTLRLHDFCDRAVMLVAAAFW